MSDDTPDAETRLREMEAMLRVCLRKLGGTVYLDTDDFEPRPREGDILVIRRWDRPYSIEMSGVLTHDEGRAILEAVGDGDRIIACDEPAFAGVTRFRTAAGHTITVFCKMGSWKYVDRVDHADGRRWEYGDGCGAANTIDGSPGEWRPHDRKAWLMDSRGSWFSRPVGDWPDLSDVPRIEEP